MASAIQAPSRMVPSALIVGYHTSMPSRQASQAASASRPRASRTGSRTANPKENPTPTSRQNFAKP